MFSTDTVFRIAMSRISDSYVLRIGDKFLTVETRDRRYFCSVPREERRGFEGDLFELGAVHQKCVLAALYAADSIRLAEVA